MTRRYDRDPRYSPAFGSVSRGWAAAVRELPRTPVVLAVDGPAALDWPAALAGLRESLAAEGIAHRTLDLREYEADWSTVRARTGDDGTDPYYLKLARNSVADVYRELPRPARPAAGVLMVCGPGAALVDHDVLWYADLPKRYAEAAVAAGELPVGVNLGRHREPGDLRRLFYADWPMLDAHRDRLAGDVDRWFDARQPESPASLSGAAMRVTLAALATQPVRTRPYFNSTPWGGQWAARELGFAPQRGNTALGYELIAPESGVVVGSDAEAEVELPFQLLCVLYPVEMLGAEVHAEFGTSFPIRFDYLDTVDGGNLSLHLHPRADYMRAHFGWPYTQHESYYVTESAGARVYLGLQEDADLGLMRKQVEVAIERGEQLEVERFVQHHRARTGQLYLIPAGTPHASGAGNLVLEISATPYLYSLRFYDWLRKDAQGRSRPLPYAHGFANLEHARRGTAVVDDLIQSPETLRGGRGWREELLGANAEMFYEVRRFVLDADAEESAEDDTAGRFHVLNVSAGDGVLLETAGGARHDLVFAETLTVPAATGAYRLRPLGSRPVHVVKALVR
ncbi:class I mannose-6-phosphate isomerase [Amycolatopsis jiangsuensis]|uniref:Mannose-6-phosphate isomerase class I n=1 Tax=Amycolatopsis jiangsuensis TaxID=1181879 RepID=A0A840J5S6_9PSEU|nr:class I mannose-6-phosphate isomerase [Amycolatopsis jiangsuensis]MBB4688758.1 mannose-6-phosphate isomerase class I [Amycolatopsis jiangsuensis]